LLLLCNPPKDQDCTPKEPQALNPTTCPSLSLSVQVDKEQKILVIQSRSDKPKNPHVGVWNKILKFPKKKKKNQGKRITRVEESDKEMEKNTESRKEYKKATKPHHPSKAYTNSLY
jgi:hypothetical protein